MHPTIEHGDVVAEQRQRLRAMDRKLAEPRPPYWAWIVAGVIFALCAAVGWLVLTPREATPDAAGWVQPACAYAPGCWVPSGWADERRGFEQRRRATWTPPLPAPKALYEREW